MTHAEPHCTAPAETPPIGPRHREQPGDRAVAEPKLVLVVDDEQDLLEVTSFVLESEGYRVETARNGEEALARLRGGLRPELVLLDMMMPVMNGWEFLQTITAIPSLKSIPVVVLTAAGSAVVVPGAVEILRKPFDLSQLVEVVDRHARGGGGAA